MHSIDPNEFALDIKNGNSRVGIKMMRVRGGGVTNLDVYREGKGEGCHDDRNSHRLQLPHSFPMLVPDLLGACHAAHLVAKTFPLVHQQAHLRHKPL